MKRILVLLALLASATAARGQTVLSVEDSALWRVDLRTRESQLVYSFTAPPPSPWSGFECGTLAASSSGDLRCLGTAGITEIRPGAVQVLAPNPHDLWEDGGLAFDADSRLWWTGGRFIQQLDPATGAMISEKWLLLDAGCYTHALAARGNRLFAVTGCVSDSRIRLEEIDPWSGASLSAIDVSSLGFHMPRDVEFDGNGDLWFSDSDGPPVDPWPTGCVRYWRLRLSPLSAEMTSQECGAWPLAMPFMDLAAIEGTSVIEVPAVSPLGALVFVLLLAAAAWFRLRDGRGTDGTPAP
ncbi:MAG: hypothetical protein IPJ17_16685 [Holophagales bacterium]|nr:MAG: hypothetical protein IPJ17_16685 [Holophagales bacterium]